MSKWLSCTPEQLILEWKKHRDALADLPKDQAISEVIKFWQDCPRHSRMIDYYTPETWPIPWEILNDGRLCDSLVSLMMYYTLKLTHPEIKVSLYLIDSEKEEYLVPVIDDRLLNYDYYRSVSFKKEKSDFKVVERIDLNLVPEIL